MVKKYYEKIGESVISETLDNGLTVYVVPKSGFSKSFAFLAVNYGAADAAYFINGERASYPDGIAHFLEHKMFDMPDGNALQQLSVLGANPNAFTSKEITAYYFETSENFDECLEILLNFVTTAYFTQSSVDKEQGIIAQEIGMIENNPNWRVYMNLYKALYSEHPVRIPIAGTVETIGKITAETLTECHSTFYCPQNMVLCVVGSVDAEKILQAAAKLPKVSAPSVSFDYGAEEAPEPKTAYVSENMEVSAPIVMAGIKCTCEKEGNSAYREDQIAELACQCICGESSALFSALYAEGLINDTFDIDWELCRGSACFIFGGESDKPLELTERIKKEIERIAVEGVDEALFNRLKKAFLGRIIRSFDSFESVCYSVAKTFFKKEDLFLITELYDNISADDVNEFIRQKLKTENMAVSVVYPKGEDNER